MKIFIHIGMPKSGSTAIQWTGHSNFKVLAEEHGIYYAAASRGELNDARLYTYLVQSDFGSFHAVIAAAINAACLARCSRVLFSAERLFTTLQDKANVTTLIEELAKYSDLPVTSITVIRDLRTFLRSYIFQLLNNGGVLIDDIDLARWAVRCTKTIHSIAARSILLSYSCASQNKQLTNEFFSLIAGRPVNLPVRIENVTSSRPSSLAPVIGCISRLNALALGADVNSAEVDRLRWNCEALFDALASNVSNGRAVAAAFETLGELVDESIQSYIEVSLSRIPEVDIQWYNERIGQLATHNWS